MVQLLIPQFGLLFLSILLNVNYFTITDAFRFSHHPTRSSFYQIKAEATTSHTLHTSYLNVVRSNSYLHQSLSEDNDSLIEISSSNLQKIGNCLKKKELFKNNNLTYFTTAAIALATVICTLPLASNAASPIIEATSSITAATTLPSVMTQFYETGFYQAFSLVFVSEIGDKTFFIAGLLAIKFSRFLSFLGSIGALAVMTVISCAIGQIFHAVPSEFLGLDRGIPLDDIAAVIAFTFFGFKTLKEALEMDDGNGVMDEELADAEEAVDGSDIVKQENTLAKILSIFTLVFAAEFGDRSFLATIALSAAQNPLSVAGGAIAAHAAATGIAVLGGGVIAKYVSERVISLISASLFLVFAFTTALGIF